MIYYSTRILYHYDSKTHFLFEFLYFYKYYTHICGICITLTKPYWIIIFHFYFISLYLHFYFCLFNVLLKKIIFFCQINHERFTTIYGFLYLCTQYTCYFGSFLILLEVYSQYTMTLVDHYTSSFFDKQFLEIKSEFKGDISFIGHIITE